MSKTTRINTEMRYINNRQQFTISDLMAEFQISRSTAARDLVIIQELGMPLISSVGPDGGFTVMRNQLLPAVQFNTEELKALFVSFMATTNQQLPFLQNRQTLTEKLLAIASQTQQDTLIDLQKLLRFENTNPLNTDILELTDVATPQLKRLINAALINRHLQLTYIDATIEIVYVQYLAQQQAKWSLVCFSLTTDQLRTIPLRQIKAVKTMPTRLDAATMARRLQQATPKPTITLQLGPQAISQFKRLHQPDQYLQFLDPFEQSARFQTYLDLNDGVAVTAFVDWLLFLGQDVRPQQFPSKLRQLVQKRLQSWQD